MIEINIQDQICIDCTYLIYYVTLVLWYWPFDVLVFNHNFE